MSLLDRLKLARSAHSNAVRTEARHGREVFAHVALESKHSDCQLSHATRLRVEDP